MLKVTRVSPFTGQVHTKFLSITEEQIAAYQSGVLLQNAFPNLTPGEREFFKTGITDEEWDNLFSQIT